MAGRISYLIKPRRTSSMAIVVAFLLDEVGRKDLAHALQLPRMLRRDNDEAIDALPRIVRNRAMGVILRCDF